MSASTVNISFKKELLEQIDRVAVEESRTRSELIREAARLYIEKKKRWESIFDFGNAQVARLGLTEDDIEDEIINYRSHKGRKLV